MFKVRITYVDRKTGKIRTEPPTEEELANVAARYFQALMEARWGDQFEIKIEPVKRRQAATK